MGPNVVGKTFAFGRQHAGTSVAGFAAEAGSVDQGDGIAALAETPGEGSADGPGTNDQRVHLVRIAGLLE